MLFNSLRFVVFFPVVVGLYFWLPYRWRWAMLLVASYYFYMCWRAEYALLILFSTTIDYFVGRMMGRIAVQSKRRNWLALSLVTNFGLLFGFKYFNFFNDSFRELFNRFNLFYDVPAFQVLLPVGISFYTFQAVSYTVDVYRGVKEPEPHFGIFALYVAFFPQLVAGPIERSTHLLPQFFEKRDFDWRLAADGLRLMLWGFFKKLVIADRLALYVQEVFDHPGQYQGGPVWLAAYFFAIQIYCDFSGYSDIAIGSAQVLGYRLMDNFKRPYFADSIGEFWKRWHISLTTWFRDYVYIPLGGNRVALPRWQANIVIVFLVSGLWHGANWTFVFWGALHGTYYLVSYWTAALRQVLVSVVGLTRLPNLHRIVRVLITFHLVVFAYIFFRAESISTAFVIIRDLFAPGFSWPALHVMLTPTDLMVGCLGVVVLLVAEAFLEWDRPDRLRSLFATGPRWFRWGFYYAAAMSILIFGKFTSNPFIYFQF
ncbi:MAG: MBOAT family protein [Candidatus Hydrogenedentes bacterium]|nr:MBOAT family protein [Candidatus Hydrogenedentota bacterium]